MTSIAQINENEQSEIRGSLKKFFAEYHLSGLLKMCRAEKQKGFSAFEIFRLCIIHVSRLNRYLILPRTMRICSRSE